MYVLICNISFAGTWLCNCHVVHCYIIGLLILGSHRINWGKARNTVGLADKPLYFGAEFRR